MASTISDEVADQLLRACRTVIGDELRSLTYFTPSDHEHIYLREDLERADDSVGYVETERRGFETQRTYDWSELGEYRYTIRAFENGYIVRVLMGKRGAYVTTDALTMERFDEVAEAVREILAEIE